MNPLEELSPNALALAQGMLQRHAQKRDTRYLEAIQRVASGYRAPKRSVRIREDRSITLYKSLGQPRKSHDSLKERVKHYRRVLRGNPLNASARSQLSRYVEELDNRRAGNPTEGFEV